MSILKEKFKEVLLSVVPIVIIVIFLGFTLVDIPGLLMSRFLVGSTLVILGLAIFLLGVDVGITPIGNLMGEKLAKSNRIWIIAIVGFFLGFVISVAEPDIHILADQVASVTNGALAKNTLVIVVSLGLALMMSLGLIRIVKSVKLNIVFTISYGIILLLSLISPEAYLAIGFDSSGATTGALTVPFMLAIATGVSRLKKDSKASEEDSFGLVGITSSGAILGVLLMSALSKTGELTGGGVDVFEIGDSIIMPFIHEFPIIVGEVSIALLPIIAIFLIFQRYVLKARKSTVRRILFGMSFTFVGLVLFLVGVHAGFMEVGYFVGYALGNISNKFFVIIVAFALGLVTILAEPAVHVLTQQIEDVTSGYVNKTMVFVALCIGVGAAVALSVIRILIPEIRLWHYLLPGFLLSIILSYMVPNLFVGIAFDSGGVASGPMTATFILSYTQGVASATSTADVLIDGFGVIAVVAMTPIIALQILGLLYKIKSKKAVK
ncbi:MAG: DUF1538 domain-containing protein [Erysipelotrichaceae bacterium]|nr:DUF1538 domain-containing protein [Erysipelotrichaceae bacterium]